MPCTGIIAAAGIQVAIRINRRTPPPAPKLAVIIEVTTELASRKIATDRLRLSGSNAISTRRIPRIQELGFGIGLRLPAAHRPHNTRMPAQVCPGPDCETPCQRQYHLR